jgi:hypothetical protein
MFITSDSEAKWRTGDQRAMWRQFRSVENRRKFCSITDFTKEKVTIQGYHETDPVTSIQSGEGKLCG